MDILRSFSDFWEIVSIADLKTPHRLSACSSLSHLLLNLSEEDLCIGATQLSSLDLRSQSYLGSVIDLGIPSLFMGI